MTSMGELFSSLASPGHRETEAVEAGNQAFGLPATPDQVKGLVGTKGDGLFRVINFSFTQTGSVRSG